MLKSIASSFLNTVKRKRSSGLDTTDAHVKERHMVRAATLVFGMVFGIILPLFVFSSSALAATYYIAPGGSNGNNGLSAGAEWQTFGFAIPRLNAGDTLLLMDGTYTNSNSGLPRMDCSSGIHSGTASQPITLKALNERRAHLQGNGTIVVYLYGCSYWVIEGLYASNSDVATSGFDGSTFYAEVSDHLTFRRNLAYNPNAWFNSHAFSIITSTTGLIEENEVYYVHRHGIALLEGSSGFTVRRNYVHSRDHFDMPGGVASDPPGEVRGDTGYTCYPCNNNIFENNIAEDWDAGFDIQCKTNCGNNKYYGNIVNHTRFGFLFAARNDFQTGPDIQPTNEVLQNNVTMNSELNGVGGYFRTNNNTHLDNMSFLGGSSDGLDADLQSGSGAVIGPSIFGTNILVMNYAASGLNISSQGSWSFDHILVNGNGINSPSLGDSHFSNVLTSNPNLGTCKVFIPSGSPAKGAGVGGTDIGANVLYRYQDGVLTNQPLWDPVTGKFPCGAIVTGVNDIAGSSCFDANIRLNVNTNNCSLPAGYNSSTAPAPTANLTATSLTITSGQSSTLTWSATNATSCSASGGWSGTKLLSGSLLVSPTVTTNYSLTCTGSTGSASASITITVGVATSVSTVPLAWYKLDDTLGITAKDSAIADGVQNGTLINSPLWTTGKLGGALQLDGINDYVRILASPALDLTGDMTVALWVKQPILNNGTDIYAHREDAVVPSAGFFLRMNDTRFCTACINFAATGGNRADSNSNVITTGVWQHIAAVRSGTTVTFYVNGLPAGSGIVSSITPALAAATCLGLDCTSGAIAPGDSFNGSIDDVRLYNRALSAAEVQSIMVPPDVIPPTVSVTAPTAGAVVSGTVPVSANSSDNTAVVGVQFFLSGPGIVNQPLGPEDTTAPSPFTLTGGWNTTTGPNGSYTITAVTRDAAGNKTTSLPLTVTVRNALPILSTHLSVFSVDSEELVGENGAATNAIDGNPLTIWHTQWTDSLGNVLGAASPPPPHTIVLKLDTIHSVSGLGYLPRQDVPEVNGTVKGYNIFLSTDGVNWGLAVSTGTFLNTAEEKRVNFTARNALYIKFVAVSEVNAGPWTSAAEIKLFGTLPIDTTAPTIPTTLKATPISSAQVNLSWTASTDAIGVVGYDVYRNGIKIARTTTTTYADTTLTALTTYTYAVSAYDAAGNLSTRSFSASAKTLKFKAGDTIKVANGPLNVRSCAGTLCAINGIQPLLGQTGTIIAGPTIANAFTWWNIDYATGADGWSVENYIVGNATVLPALGVRTPERTTEIASITSQLESVNQTINSYTENPSRMNASVLTSLADTLREMQRLISALAGE